MKHGLAHALGVVGLGLATFTVTPAHAQTAANGPYYATPSWDQTLPSSTRFIVLSNFNNQAVLDRETGLVWQRSPLGSAAWPLASALCLSSTQGNRLGWRLPTINELQSIFDPSATAAPALPSGHPFTGFGPLFGSFWSATPTLSGGSHHSVEWVDAPPFGFSFLLDSVQQDTGPLTAWCVRGGLQAGPQ